MEVKIMKKKIAVVLILSLSVTFLLAVSVYSKGDPFLDLGKQKAEVLINSSEKDVIAKVNGQPILRVDYDLSLKEISVSEVQAEKNLRDAAELPLIQEKIEELKQLSARYSPEARALAHILSKELTYQEALKKGFVVSEEEIKEYCDWVKENMETARSDNPEFNEFVGTIGEDTYLKEILPNIMKKSLAIGKLKAEMNKGISISEANKRWHLYSASLIKEADIELIDPELRSSMVEEAVDVIEAFADFE
jgi:hypothetical protein